MSDALRRAVRTIAQFTVSASATAVVNTLADGITPTQKLLVLAGFQFAVTWAHNALEDSPRVAFPAVLKAEPSPGVHPVTVDPIELDDAGLPPAPTVKKAKPAKKPAVKKAAKR